MALVVAYVPVACRTGGGGLSLEGPGMGTGALAALLGPSSFVCYPNTQSRDRNPGDPAEDTMGSKTDQIKGLANQAAGKLKQGVGKITGSTEAKAKGAVQEVKGKAQQTMGKGKSAVKDTANKVADKANKKL